LGFEEQAIKKRVMKNDSTKPNMKAIERS